MRALNVVVNRISLPLKSEYRIILKHNFALVRDGFISNFSIYRGKGNLTGVEGLYTVTTLRGTLLAIIL